MAGKDDGDVIVKFAGNDEFLLIAAGEIAHQRARS